MTTNRTNPVVSVDPERTVELDARIAEWRAVLKGHQQTLKDMGNRGGLKAERKATQATIARCEAAIEDLKTHFPPTYVDPFLAQAYILEELAGLNRFEAVKAEFIERIQTNPKNAIEWNASAMVQAQTVYEYLLKLFKMLDGVGIEGMGDVIKAFREDLVTEVLGDVRDSHSTSPFDNVVEKMTLYAMKELATGWSLGRIEATARSLAEQVAKTADTRFTFKQERQPGEPSPE